MALWDHYKRLRLFATDAMKAGKYAGIEVGVTVNPAVTLQERRQKGYNLLQKSSKRSKKCFEANWSELSGYTKNCDEVPAVGLG